MKKSTLLSIILFLFCGIQIHASEFKSFYYSGEDELSLEGNWMFYWEQLLSSGDSAIENSGFKVKLPNYWNKHKNGNFTPPSFGYATYKTIIVSDSTRDIAIEYTGPHCAQKILMNGELVVTTGKVGKSFETYEALWLPGTVKSKLNKGENELIIQIANFDHSKGGIYKAPVIGRPDVLLSKRDRKLFLDSFLAGGMFIIGIFFLGLSFFWRKNRLYTYFGIFAALFSFWFINYGMHAFKVYFTDMTWNMSIHLTYLAFYGFMFFISLFIYEAFKTYFGKYYLKIILIGYSILFLTVIIGSPHFFTSFLFYGHILVFGQLFYAAILLINAVRMKAKGSVLGVLSIFFLVMSSLSVLGMFYSFLPWMSEIAGILYLITFLLFSVLMANKVGGSYKAVLELQQQAIAQKEKIEEQATKLRLLDEMKTRFFANVSHDLRSPLTLIKGSVHKLKKTNTHLGESHEKDYQTIDANIDQLIQFTNEIRDLNLLDKKAFTLSYAAIEVNFLLKVTSDLFRSLAETRGITLIFTPEDSDLLIYADDKKIRKVLNNLLSNAFKFTDDNGKIELLVKKGNGGVLIELKDSGMGIAEEEQPFVFDRFYQGKRNMYRSEEGMGIGLALVQELILLHDGTIDLVSEVGVGSTFTLFLPYNLDKPLSQEKVDFQPEASPNLKKEDSSNLAIDFDSGRKSAEHTILLVDDHHDVRKYIASVIHERYYIIEAKNGVEAYEILQKQKIDLVITDLMMPWMDGFELIDKMNADSKLSSVKIMVVSARTTHDDKLKVLDKGVNEFISKPFDEDEFNGRISNILNGKSPSVLHDLAEKKGKYSDIEKNVLQKVNNLIMEQIDNSKLTTAVLADELATSERNASRIIKKLTSLPPKAYIQKVRMDYAELLLKEGKVKSLTEASQAIGINNVTQFTTQFEKIKGFHPSEV